MTVQVIGSDVCPNGHVGTPSGRPERLELEAGEFEDHGVVGTNEVEFIEQQAANVAAYPDAPTWTDSDPEDVADHARGRGLPVRAGDRDGHRRVEFLTQEPYRPLDGYTVRPTELEEFG